MELVAIVIVGAVIYFLVKDSSAKAKTIEQLSYENRSLKSEANAKDKANDLELYMQAREKYQIVLREKQYYEKQYKELLETMKGPVRKDPTYEELDKDYSLLKARYSDLEDKYDVIRQQVIEEQRGETKNANLQIQIEEYKEKIEELKKEIRTTEEICKMREQALEVRLISERNESARQEEAVRKRLQKESNEIERFRKEMAEQHKKERMSVLEKIKEVQAIQKLCEENIKAAPWLSVLYADYIEAKTIEVSDKLATKKNPALKAAEVVRDIAKKQREWVQAAKLYQYTKNYYEFLIPELSDLLDFSVEEELPELNQPPSAEQDDPAKRWLSSDEYRKLPTVERNQLSLDRYLGRKKKTKREIGREYERYIGYCYEKDGYKVQYRGIIDGFEDLGRDLICINSDHVVIVQCKCWSADKAIREKHVNQLYGTGVMYAVENGLNGGQEGLFDPKHGKVRTRLITSTELSPVARRFADYLGVEYEENHKHGEYPVVKCNINRQTNEKIYHLPFDQLYDRVDVEKERGEFFAWTVKEAEDAGFRRAMRWHGEKNGVT